MFTQKLNQMILSTVVIIFTIIITGCASEPYVEQPAPTIMINTIPSGADISVQGSYVGKSPVAIPAPPKYTGYEPIRIEAVLEGYETKNVSFGDYHPPVDEVLKKTVETDTMIYQVPAGTKTIPAYYTFRNSIDIKLYPKTK